MRISRFGKLISAIGVSGLAGFIGSLFTTPSIPTWYAGLIKPALNPPGWVFGPVWTVLYILMGIALWRAWNRKNVRVFIVQLVLNAVWSILFFGMHRPDLAFVDIIALWVAIVWTIVLFRRVSTLAAWLLVPYLLWVSFASYLNFSIWMLN